MLSDKDPSSLTETDVSLEVTSRSGLPHSNGGQNEVYNEYPDDYRAVGEAKQGLAFWMCMMAIMISSFIIAVDLVCLIH